MEGSPQISVIFWNMSGLIIHSFLSEKTRDARSASTFFVPGIWAAVNHICLSLHHCQIFLAIVLHSLECVPPIALI